MNYSLILLSLVSLVCVAQSGKEKEKYDKEFAQKIESVISEYGLPAKVAAWAALLGWVGATVYGPAHVDAGLEKLYLDITSLEIKNILKNPLFLGGVTVVSLVQLYKYTIKYFLKHRAISQKYVTADKMYHKIKNFFNIEYSTWKEIKSSRRYTYGYGLNYGSSSYVPFFIAVKPTAIMDIEVRMAQRAGDEKVLQIFIRDTCEKQITYKHTFLRTLFSLGPIRKVRYSCPKFLVSTVKWKGKNMTYKIKDQERYNLYLKYTSLSRENLGDLIGPSRE